MVLSTRQLKIPACLCAQNYSRIHARTAWAARALARHCLPQSGNADSEEQKIVVRMTPVLVTKFLGPPKMCAKAKCADRKSVSSPLGLEQKQWRDAANRSKHHGRKGKLAAHRTAGDVMKESAHAAFRTSAVTARV